jgi:hypothetical protein
MEGGESWKQGTRTWNGDCRSELSGMRFGGGGDGERWWCEL